MCLAEELREKRFTGITEKMQTTMARKAWWREQTDGLLAGFLPFPFLVRPEHQHKRWCHARSGWVIPSSVKILWTDALTDELRGLREDCHSLGPKILGVSLYTPYICLK